MSTSTIVYETQEAASTTRLGDYAQLVRPKIAVMELVTVAVGACVASSGVPAAPWILLHAMLGTTLLAASASIINQWLECDSDRRMQRTADRPLPAGRMSGTHVLTLGFISGIAGMAYLISLVNLLTALLGFASWFFYVAAYTPLKFRTTSNTMVGAISGGIPVLMGWTAVSGSFEGPHGLMAATLFMIVFLWQFPHFMAIAWLYREDYTAAGIQVIPVVDPTGRRAGAQAILAALVLVPVSLLPAVLTWTLAWNLPYLVCAFLLGTLQLGAAIQFSVVRDEVTARRLLRASLIYLPAVLGLLLVLPFVIPRIL